MQLLNTPFRPIRQRNLRYRDVEVLLALASFQEWPGYKGLAKRSRHPESQCHNSVKYWRRTRMINPDGTVNRANLGEFIEGGLKYMFPPERKKQTLSEYLAEP